MISSCPFALQSIVEFVKLNRSLVFIYCYWLATCAVAMRLQFCLIKNVVMILLHDVNETINEINMQTPIRNCCHVQIIIIVSLLNLCLLWCINLTKYFFETWIIEWKLLLNTRLWINNKCYVKTVRWKRWILNVFKK